MVSSRQIRAARMFLGWTQRELAEKAGVAINTVARLEKGEGDPRLGTVNAIEKALARAGIEFIPEDGREGEGVRLARPPASSRTK
jgi:transcriptional regulator with XRE-family HTH domain